MKPKVPGLASFGSGGARVDMADRDALYEVMEGGRPAWLPESFRLVVEVAGEVRLPEEVRAALSLGPRDLLAIRRNAISLRLDPYRELLESLRGPEADPGGWRCVEQFLQRPLAEVREDGAVEIPEALMALAAGATLVLEVVREGLGHALYLYPYAGAELKAAGAG